MGLGALPRPILSLCLAFLSCGGPSLVRGASVVNIIFPVNASASSLVNPVHDNFLGVSWELSAFNDLWGNTNTTMPNAMQNYLSNLRARLYNPLRIRVGGNSMDASTYVPAQKNMITLTDSSAYFNDEPTDFGPVLFEVMNAMSAKVGSMQFIIGLSMEDPNDDMDNLMRLASDAESYLGDQLDAMLLGNEPDLYANHGTRANYTIQDYIPEIGEIVGNLSTSSYGNLINKTIVGGPSTCCNWDLGELISAGLNQYPYKYYTLQHYPKYSCSGLNADNTNVTYFLTHANVDDEFSWTSAGVKAAKAAGTPVILTEYNTVSCGGSNISSYFMASLWLVDAGLKAASSNYTAAYIHTREWNVTYNLFDPPSADTATESGWRTGSPYYAALMLSESFSKNGSVVQDLNLDNSIYDQQATVAGYGIWDYNPASGLYERSKVVLINFGSTSQTFYLPANTTAAIASRLLTAPSVYEETNISWAGQTVGQNGDLEGGQTTVQHRCKEGCNITVSGPGVLLGLFDPKDGLDEFYSGNSTIAGLTGYASGTSALLPSLRTAIGFSAVAISILVESCLFVIP